MCFTKYSKLIAHIPILCGQNIALNFYYYRSPKIDALARSHHNQIQKPITMHHRTTGPHPMVEEAAEGEVPIGAVETTSNMVAKAMHTEEGAKEDLGSTTAIPGIPGRETTTISNEQGPKTGTT